MKLASTTRNCANFLEHPQPDSEAIAGILAQEFKSLDPQESGYEQRAVVVENFDQYVSKIQAAVESFVQGTEALDPIKIAGSLSVLTCLASKSEEALLRLVAQSKSVAMEFTTEFNFGSALIKKIN